jgi:hypothetical protein
MKRYPTYAATVMILKVKTKEEDSQTPLLAWNLLSVWVYIWLARDLDSLALSVPKVAKLAGPPPMAYVWGTY